MLPVTGRVRTASKETELKTRWAHRIDEYFRHTFPLFMKTVDFSCTSCGATVTAESKYAGCQVICPSCNTAVMVPESAAAAPTAPAAAGGASSGGGGMKIMAIVVGVAVVVGGGVGAVIALKNRGGDSTGSQPNNQAASGAPSQSSGSPLDAGSPESKPATTSPSMSKPASPTGSFQANGSNPWPQFRGPKRDGRSTETGLLKQWPSGGPRLLWKARGLGSGYSSVSVAGGMVLTMGDSSGGNSQVHAIDEATGNKIWSSSRVGKTGGNYDGTKSTPAIDLANGKVYALGQFGDLVCLNTSDGSEVWRKNMQSDFGGSVGGWNYSESPLLDGDRVVVSPGGRQGVVVALNTASGSTLWQSRQFAEKMDYVSLVPSTVGGRPNYIQMTQQTLAAVDAQSGNLVWRIPRAGKTAVIPSPVVYNNIVFVTSGYGVGCNAFQINSQGGRLTTRKLYENRELANHHGGIVLVDKYVYGHSDRGGWKCMDVTNGRVVWANNGVGKGAVVYADGHLICRSERNAGEIALVEASPNGYREKGRFAQPDRSRKNSWAHPVVANRKLFLRDQDILLCYDLKNG